MIPYSYDASDRTDYPLNIYPDFITPQPKPKRTWKSDKPYWSSKCIHALKTQVTDFRKMGAM